MKIIGAIFRGDNRIYKFKLNSEEIKKGDYVIVDLEKEQCIGQVVELMEITDDISLPPVERKATKEDIAKDIKNMELEKTAFEFCKERILAHKLDMKLIRVKCLFDKSKLVFYYTAEGRVDFRELLKDLVKRFRMRIELRQVGVRNETQMLGGIGPCGRELCCTLFLDNFAPVSVKMAKEQYISLNPEKISGLCGRLMCCLAYEFPVYQQFKEGFPNSGETIKAGDLEGKIIRYSLPRHSIFIETKEGQEIEIPIEKIQGKK